MSTTSGKYSTVEGAITEIARLNYENRKLETQKEAAEASLKDLQQKAFQLVDALGRDYNAELPKLSSKAFSEVVHALPVRGLRATVVPEKMRRNKARKTAMVSLMVIGALTFALIAWAVV